MRESAVRFTADFPVKDLVVLPKNSRAHTDRDIQALIRSIEHYGFVNPIIARDRDKVVVAGHGRIEAARRKGWATVPVIFRDFTDQDLVAYSIADNRHAELSDWDKANLKDNLVSLESEGYDLTLTGFTPDDLQALLEWDARHDEDPDAVPPIPDVAVTQPGDLWVLGDHRILCADATQPESFRALLGTRRAALVFTDPPYGVDYQAQSGKHDAIQNDALGHGELEAFLYRCFTNLLAVTDDDAAYYVWHASATRGAFTYAMTAAGLVEHQYLIWIKPAAALGHDDYQWAHEPCFYAAKVGHRPRWYGDRAQPTVWRFSPVSPNGIVATVGKGLTLLAGPHALHLTTQPPKVKKQRTLRIPDGRTLLIECGAGETSTAWEVSRDAKPDHPTQKPTALAMRAMRNSSQYGEAVVDCFLGSGSTLIAAEQMGRHCYGIELEPKYVDVAVRRWEQFTGKRAERIRP